MTFKELALISPVFATFFSSLILFFNERKNNKPKIILGVFMATSCVLLISIIFYQKENYHIYRYLDSVFMSFLLLFNPLYYLYVRSLTVSESSQKRTLIHFIPAILVFTLSFFIWVQLNNEESFYYLGHYMEGEFIDNDNMKILYTIFIIDKYLFAAQAVLYFILIYKMLKDHREHINNLYSYEGMFKLNWALVILFILLSAELAGIAVNFVNTKELNQNEFTLGILLLLFAVIYMAMGITGSKQGNILLDNEYDIVEDEENEIRNESNDLSEEIRQYFEKEKPYLNKQLKIWDLCVYFATNRTYLSQLINTEFGMNFSSLVNKYRVEEAKRIMNDENAYNYTFEKIASDAGFNSLSSFNRAFKKFEGITPGMFKK